MSEGETAATSEKIGGILRDAREAANATLDDISALLKIRSDHLQALENDDFERLPGSVYAIGFIRTYATHLGLNAGELIERYKAAVAVPHLEDQGPNPQTETEPISGALKISIGVAAVFVVYILWLIAGGAGDDDNNSRFAETAAPAREVPIEGRHEAPAAQPPANQTVAAPRRRKRRLPPHRLTQRRSIRLMRLRLRLMKSVRSAAKRRKMRRWKFVPRGAHGCA